MFKIGDEVVGNWRMSAFENRGAVGKIERGVKDNWVVRWSCGRLTQGIDDHKLDHRNYGVLPVPVPSVCDVASIGEEILSTLAARGKQYDKDGTKERSMAKTVEAFNAITGQDLTAVQGWAFMQVLKQVRFFSNTTEPHRDSLIDNGAYALLQAEEALNAKV